MTVKYVTAIEYDGVLYGTHDEVVKARAVKALKEAFKNRGYYSDNRFFDILDDPRKCYEVLKEIYDDR